MHFNGSNLTLPLTLPLPLDARSGYTLSSISIFTCSLCKPSFSIVFNLILYITATIITTIATIYRVNIVMRTKTQDSLLGAGMPVGFTVGKQSGVFDDHFPLYRHEMVLLFPSNLKPSLQENFAVYVLSVA